MTADFSVVSRRRFLKVTLGVGGALFMGGGTAVLAVGGWSPDVAGVQQLTDREYRTLTALAHALFPRGGAFPIGAADLDLARAFDTYLDGEPEFVRSDLKRALFLLEWGPVIFERRLRTFSRLREDERLAFFQRWAEGSGETRRQVTLAFRKFLATVFYDNPRVWPHIHYAGPSLLTGERV